MAEAEETADGSYVRYAGLTRPGQLKFDRRAQFQVCEFGTATTLADEATMYLLVNGGGTPHSQKDLELARRVSRQ